ncbi:MAG: YbjQ family protein [Propionibacteriaceae bacterium]|nr:YbjQ family protein [Propionibacteriaceae bacterium]
MLIVTTNSIPGYQIDAVLGEVMGMTVRSANIGQNLIAGFKALGGGEVSQYTDLVYDSRNQVMQRMWDMCVQRGGNAIIAMRFDTGDIGQTFSEVCAYGTAVVVRPIADEARGGTPQSIGEAHTQAAQPQQPPMPPQQPGATPYGYAPQS